MTTIAEAFAGHKEEQYRQADGGGYLRVNSGNRNLDFLVVAQDIGCRITGGFEGAWWGVYAPDDLFGVLAVKDSIIEEYGDRDITEFNALLASYWENAEKLSPPETPQATRFDADDWRTMLATERTGGPRRYGQRPGWSLDDVYCPVDFPDGAQPDSALPRPTTKVFGVRSERFESWLVEHTQVEGIVRWDTGAYRLWVRGVPSEFELPVDEPPDATGLPEDVLAWVRGVLSTTSIFLDALQDGD